MKLFGRGGLNVVAVCAVVFGLGMVASVVLNMLQAQRAADDKAQLKGQINDLSYQVAQDHKQLSGQTPDPTPTPDATPEVSPSPAPSSSPAVLGSHTIKLTDLGVTVTVSDPVGDLTYANQSKNGYTIDGLTTASLNAKYPKCIASYLGQIAKVGPNQKPLSGWSLIKKIDVNSYYYIKPIVECATDAAGKTQRASLVNAIQNTVLPTLN